eukprot:scaffold175514_cov19-Prasinocladus_malaysianus.AAC.1
MLLMCRLRAGHHPLAVPGHPREEHEDVHHPLPGEPAAGGPRPLPGGRAGVHRYDGRQVPRGRPAGGHDGPAGGDALRQPRPAPQ